MRKIRTIQQLVAEIKQQDPNSAITEHYIRRLINEGAINYKKSGSKYLIDLQEMENYFEGANI